MGMTEEQYWDRDCDLAIHFRKAYDMGREQHNQEAWLQGNYVYHAICAVSPILHAFAKKGAKALPYLREPHAITQGQVEEREAKEDQKVFNKGMLIMEKFMADTNEKFKESDGA